MWKTRKRFWKRAERSGQDLALGGDGHHLPGEEFAAALEGLLDRQLDPAAAGDLHAHHGDALDVVVGQNFGELFAVIHAVQLGTAHQGNFSTDKVPVEVGVGVGSAVGGHQELGPVQPGWGPA